MKILKNAHKIINLIRFFCKKAMPISQQLFAMESKISYGDLVINKDNKKKYAGEEKWSARKFEWFEHNFIYNGEEVKLLYRLYIPKVIRGRVYPLVMTLHGAPGMGSDNKKHLDITATIWAEDYWQKKHPSYILAIQMPFEGEVSMESELSYLYEYGEIIKKVATEFGNIDMERIYTTGLSQGAGFSYGVTIMQPDLYAAALINSGTSVHTTWGEQFDLSKILGLNLYIVHGAKDEWILPNEAYRVYNELVSMGKRNITLEIITAEGLENRGHEDLLRLNKNGSYMDGAAGHITTLLTLNSKGTKWMKWLFEQKKGVPYAEAPKLIEWDNANAEINYPEWNMNLNYNSVGLKGENSGIGRSIVGKIRISAPGNIAFDYPDTELKSGDIIYYTLQGYTGVYGDDLEAFHKEWKFEYTIKSGSVASVEVTDRDVPGLVRPASVMYGGGSGPTKEGSLANKNVLSRGQVYLKIALADDFEGEKLLMHLKFTTPYGYLYYQEIDKEIRK